MKLNKFFLLIILSIFLTNCSFLIKSVESDKEKLLNAHLKFWQNIRIDGIIELNIKSLAFRKNISIKKNQKALRLDIFDSGIFGMQPTPFISAYYDSVLIMRTPDQRVEKLTQTDPNNIDLSILFDLPDLYSIKGEIIHNKKLVMKDVTIYFSEEMQIVEIFNEKNSTRILFKYLQNLDSIYFLKEDKEIINIQIDKISHNVDTIESIKY